MTVDETGSNGAASVGNCLTAFTFNVDSATRSITLKPSSINNSHSGVYTIVITGWNSLSTTNTASLSITFTVHPACGDDAIVAPTGQTFSNYNYENGG